MQYRQGNYSWLMHMELRAGFQLFAPILLHTFWKARLLSFLLIP